MKAALTSAMSLAALLAFETRPTLGGPVFDLSAGSIQSGCNNIHSPSDCTLTFYVLPGEVASTQATTMKALQTSNLTFAGVTVAPVQSVSSTSSGDVLIGGNSAEVTVTNTRNGNLDSSFPLSFSHLNGKVGSGNSVFVGPGVTQLKRPGPENGPRDKGRAQSTTVVIGPLYQSQWPGGTNNTRGKNGGSPTSTIDFGTVDASSGQHTKLLQLLNITTDDEHGNVDLANLSIESFAINAKNGNELVSINLDAKGTASGYDAILTLFTHENAAFGTSGNAFVYSLPALPIVTPTLGFMLLLLSIGIGGVLVVRKWRTRSVLPRPR